MEIDSFQLRKIAFFCSVTGILLLAFFTNFLQEQKISLKELNESMLNQKVSVKGIVSEKEINYSGHLVFYLNEENTKIKVI
ncbi:MAG: hypothetical protein JW703_02350, partial [Candidatus Diapherotrites archaeon]|nr:hypothetical protein [Candidatus Diapherotrites archaeon]